MITCDHSKRNGGHTGVNENGNAVIERTVSVYACMPGPIEHQLEC